VTSSNNIFQTLGIQRLVMLTNNSECISTIGYVVLQFIRASERWPQCLKVWLQVFQSQSTSSDFHWLYLQNAWDPETGDAHKRFSVHSYHRICGATIYQRLRAPTLVSQSLTLISDFQRRYLSNAWDPETSDAHKRFSVHFYHRICGATIYQSLRAPTLSVSKFDCILSEPEHF